MKSNSNYNSEYLFILHINNKLYSSPHKDVSNIFYIFRTEWIQFEAHMIKINLMVYSTDNNHCLNFCLYCSTASKMFSFFLVLKISGRFERQMVFFPSYKRKNWKLLRSSDLHKVTELFSRKCLDSNQIFWHLVIPDLFAYFAYLNGTDTKMKEDTLKIASHFSFNL